MSVWHQHCIAYVYIYCAVLVDVMRHWTVAVNVPYQVMWSVKLNMKCLKFIFQMK